MIQKHNIPKLASLARKTTKCYAMFLAADITLSSRQRQSTTEQQEWSLSFL